ncbi:MAG: MFS transporter [Planctomycetota bacterium]
MTAQTARKPGVWTKLAYGFGAVGDGVKNNGFEYFLLLYYGQVLGVDFALVGAALLIAMIVDGFTDPIVGYWSDNLRTRFGRRHPFMYFGFDGTGSATAATAAIPEPGVVALGLIASLAGFTRRTRSASNESRTV